MIYVGDYRLRFYKNGLFRLPSKWVKPKIVTLYCVECKDKVLGANFLQFYYSYEDLKECIMNVEEDSDVEIVRCSRHRMVPFLRLIHLPEEFCEKVDDYFGKYVRCVGAGNRFEIWDPEDFGRFLDEQRNFEDVLKIFDFENLEL